MKTKPKLTFITRQYPPNPNINGESVWDMVSYLEEKHDILSNIITVGRGPVGLGGAERMPKGVVHTIRPLFEGEGKLKRLFNFLYEGYKLAKVALKFKDTHIIVTSSPPLLPFWAYILFGADVRWTLWTLDLFPEAFAATGQVNENNPIYIWVKKMTYQSNPFHLIALGPKQARHVKDEFGKEICTSILPCGLLFNQQKSEEIPSWYEEGKVFLGYCGKLEDAHNPAIIFAVANSMDPTKHKLVLALYGSKAQSVKDSLYGQENIIFVNTVPRSQLHFIDIHLVSLTNTWTHLAVPSKAVSAISMGCPILFCGSSESDNWHMLQKAGWLVEESGNIQSQVEDFFASLTPSAISIRKDWALIINEDMKKYVIDTYELMASIANNESRYNH